MAGKLKDRLKRIQAAGGKGPQRPSRPEGSGGPERTGGAERAGSAERPLPPDWERLAPCLFYRKRLQDIAFPAAFDVSPFLIRRLSWRPPQIPPQPRLLERSRLSFVDLETTGLSTGAGTIAFAFGLGSFANGSPGDPAAPAFAVEQWFLADLEGEEAFLDAIEARLGSERVMVSYNGAIFDAAILRSRFILSGRRFPEPEQLDLLSTARRLWGRPAGGASLPEVEAFALGLPRTEDVGGSEAPERYLDWLRGSPFARIEPILDHHLSDVLSLPAVLAAADAVFREPEGSEPPRDRRRLGLLLHGLRRPGWEPLLRGEAEAGDARAATELALILNAEGRADEALALWLGQEASPFALAQAAKILEHRKRDYEGALSLAERALGLVLDDRLKDAFTLRAGRLRRKIARSGSSLNL